MKKKLTEWWLRGENPCKDGLAFAESCGFDFAKIYNTCERGDWMIWLLRKSSAIDKIQAVLLACECAEHVLVIFEKKNPSDKRPRQAIEAARNWAKNPTAKNQTLCKSAAGAAYAAACAAYVAYTAAFTACAAAFTACAAAFTAYAAYTAAAASYAAAYAADAADADDDAKKFDRKWQADKIREMIPNPYK